MKNGWFFFIGAVLIVVALYFSHKTSKHKISEDGAVDEVVESTNEAQKKPALTQATTIIMNSSDASVSTTTTSEKNIISEIVLKNFSSSLTTMTKCLSLTNVQSLGASVNPTPENLLNTLRSSLGDTVVQLDDWEQFDIIEKDKSKKRVRVDFDYPDGVTPRRRLSMYTVNAYGALEIVSLTNDQEDNPNPAFIESLKEDSQMLSEERSTRVYFSQGDELIYTTKNGQLVSFNLSRADKSYSCANLETENSNCLCP